MDNTGSSGNVCDEGYRGKSAFSELETKAMRYFVQNHPKLKIALNLHATGNLLVTPFNYSPDKTANELKTFYPEASDFYDDIFNNAGFPDTGVSGSSIITKGKTANGEASDWMLHEHGVYAMSPELGNS